MVDLPSPRAIVPRRNLFCRDKLRHSLRPDPGRSSLRGTTLILALLRLRAPRARALQFNQLFKDQGPGTTSPAAARGRLHIGGSLDGFPIRLTCRDGLEIRPTGCQNGSPTMGTSYTCKYCTKCHFHACSVVTHCPAGTSAAGSGPADSRPSTAHCHFGRRRPRKNALIMGAAYSTDKASLVIGAALCWAGVK